METETQDYGLDEPIDDIDPVDPINDIDVDVGASGSLSGRIRQRADELAKQTTVILDVPGFEGILAAEYRALEWSQITKLRRRHQRVRDEGNRELLVGAEVLLLATEEIYEVTEDDRRIPTGERWVDLAVRAGVPLADDPTQRQAMMALFKNTARVVAHFNEYSEWLAGQRQELNEDVMRDFERTGSQGSPTTR